MSNQTQTSYRQTEIDEIPEEWKVEPLLHYVEKAGI